MSIGINAANLGTEAFELVLPRAGGDICITLGQSGGLTGRYEQDEGRIGLRRITAHQLSLQKLELPLAQGKLRVEAPSVLNGVGCDAEIGERGLEGRVSLASAAAQLVFERGSLGLRAALRVERLGYEQGLAAGQRAEVGQLELGTVRVELSGKLLLSVERLSLKDVRFSLGPGGELSLDCAFARAEAVLLEQGGRSLQLAQLSFPAGLSLHGDSVRWPELALERLEATLPQLGSSPAQPAAAPAASAPRPPLDLGWLDHLHGLLAFDLLLDVRLPILPDRRATHSIRVPVHQGRIDFKQLERCLAGLENALFDFEVNDEGLIFELDPIPGISVDNVTLVTWPLPADEHVLAKARHEVRLRRLLDYRLNPKLSGGGSSPPPPSRPKGGSSGLRRLHVGNIETVLRLGGPTTLALPGLGSLRLGAGEQPALSELRLSGQLEHAPDEAPAATELRLDAEQLLLGASIADAAQRRVEVEQLGVRRIVAARLGLLGLAPRSASLNLEGLHTTAVELRGWFGGRKNA